MTKEARELLINILYELASANEFGQCNMDDVYDDIKQLNELLQPNL